MSAGVYKSNIHRVKIENNTLPGEFQGTVQQIGLQINKKDFLDIESYG